MTVHNVAWVPLVIFNVPSANQDHKCHKTPISVISDHFVSFVILLLWMLTLTEAKNAFESIEAKVFIKATLPAECITLSCFQAKGCEDALAAWEGFV